MYTNGNHDAMAIRYAEELQIEAEAAPFAWQPLLCAAVLLGLVGLVA